MYFWFRSDIQYPESFSKIMDVHSPLKANPLKVESETTNISSLINMIQY
jgi:hypothetical protein